MASSQAQGTPLPVVPTADIYEQVDRYPWETDEEFQGGLAAILGNSASPSQTADLTLRARCFYFSRKFNTHIDFDTYKAYHQAHNTSLAPTSSASKSEAPIKSEAETSNGIPSSQSTSIDELPPWTAPSAQVATSAEPDAGPSLTYQEIVDLIRSGDPVPGIKDIPPTVLEGQGTQAAAPRRKKPWERDGEATATVEATQ